MASPPGRRTKAADSTRRSSWYGLGTRHYAEKDRFGRFLDDLVFTFADVSLFAMPSLMVVAGSVDVRPFGLKATAFVAWLAMVLTAALLRGGWVRPPWTAVRGWVSWTPSILALRLVYYNLALALAVVGGVTLAVVTGTPALAGGFALLVGVGAIAAFPRSAEVVASNVASYWPTGVPGEYRLDDRR
jgi:hypothetical protein